MQNKNKYNSLRYCFLFIYSNFLKKYTQHFSTKCLVMDFSVSVSVFPHFITNGMCACMWFPNPRLHKFTNNPVQWTRAQSIRCELHKNQIQFVQICIQWDKIYIGNENKRERERGGRGNKYRDIKNTVKWINWTYEKRYRLKSKRWQ